MKKQVSILKEIAISGTRQSDGKGTSVIFSPCRDGLYVKYKGRMELVTPYLMNNEERRYTNSILIGGEIVTMVEHVFSAVNGLGIDNLIIEFESDEAPFFASSETFSRELARNLVILEDKNKHYLKIEREIEIRGEDGQYCKITPYDDFVIDITVDFRNIIGKQSFRYAFKEADYVKDLSFARSILLFEIKDENNPWADSAKHFESFPTTLPEDPKNSPYIAYSENRFITPLKDPLEPVKHKLLDFIGDAIFLGKTPLARFEIYKPGHRFNRKIVRALWSMEEGCDDLHFEHFLTKLPELKTLKNCVENNIVHREKSVFEHTMKVFKNAQNTIRAHGIEMDERIRSRFLLAICLHDYGKKDTIKISEVGTTSCDGHEMVSAQKIDRERLLDRFNLDDEDKKWVLDFIRDHAKIHNMFSQGEQLTITKLNLFKDENKSSYLEHLIFGIADLKDSYFKTFNVSEYEYRLNFLTKNLKVTTT